MIILYYNKNNAARRQTMSLWNLFELKIKNHNWSWTGVHQYGISMSAISDSFCRTALIILCHTNSTDGLLISARKPTWTYRNLYLSPERDSAILSGNISDRYWPFLQSWPLFLFYSKYTILSSLTPDDIYIKKKLKRRYPDRRYGLMFQFAYAQYASRKL